MSEANEQLDCSEIVTRLLLKAGHVQPNGEAATEAFFLKEGEQTLSVFRNRLLTQDQCQTRMNKVRGQATLHVGRIRRIGLEQGLDLNVIEDEVPPNERGHAVITGIPNRSEDFVKAERVAGLLSIHSRRR